MTAKQALKIIESVCTHRLKTIAYDANNAGMGATYRLAVERRKEYSAIKEALKIVKGLIDEQRNTV